MPYDLDLGIAKVADRAFGRVLPRSAIEQLQNERNAAAQQQSLEANQQIQAMRQAVLSKVDSSNPESLKAAAAQLMQANDTEGAKQLIGLAKELYARPSASSTIGKIQADIDAGLIDPATGAAALKKATTIAPVYDPVSGNMIYAGGGGFAQPEMGGGMGAPMGEAGTYDIPPGMNPKEAQAYREKRATLAGQTAAEDEKLFNTVSTRLPTLLKKVSEAADFGNEATYTWTGEGADFVANRIFGAETSGGIAKSAYDGIILNEVLPSLSEIFPGSVTEGERESLKDMMGASSLTPEQKTARLKQYVDAKLNKVREIGSRLGKDTSFLDTYQQQLEMIGAPKENLQNLPPDEVEYLKSKGLL